MKLSDTLWGVLCALLGITVLVYVQSFPAMPGQRFGPAVFPGLIAAGFIACGLILLLRGLRAKAPMLMLEPWTRSAPMLIRFLAVCAAIVFYVYASERLGFLITAFLCLMGLFWIFGVPRLRALVLAIAISLLIHLLFYKMMRVPLPWGLLTNMAW
jgi:putative tricarboxylic transport membrane protein